MAPGSPPVLAPGPLAPLVDGFVARLQNLGYVSSGLGGQRGLVAHLDRWMGAGGLELTDLTPTALEEFLRARAAEGYVTKLTRRGLTPLVEYLEELGLYVTPAASMTGVDRLVVRFHQHLIEERGLGDDTAANYERVARRFLALRPPPVEVSVAALTAGEVTAFVVARSREVGVDGMQTVVGGMRALLRFLYVTGLVERSLASAVPTVARRRRELPRALPGEHIALLLGVCDRATPVGIRDFAVLVMLARLGLRANEVASLRLDDIDWAAGEVCIRGKGPRLDVLPLPADVGDALVAYLQRGRPDCVDREVFIRSCAPRRGLTRQAVGGLVRAASARAGLAAPGPHRLRHTVATGLLRQGAPLVEIAQLLRHQTVRATVIYAKVDQHALSALAQPWPRGAA